MLRSRELTPYSDSLDASASNRHRDSSSPERVVTRPKQLDRETPPNPDRTRSWRKRRSGPAEERSGSDTEVEADEDMPYLTLHTSASSTSADDFPRVFVSPNITQPELFARPEELPRPDGRRTKGLPGSTRGMARGFRKTVSAPFGMGWGGMEVDRDGEDGFDVSEWAASEEF